MKPVATILACLICIQLFACNKNKALTNNSNNILDTSSMKIKITVGTNSIIASLFDNATATAFKAKLPLNIDMKELNGNEKYFDLPSSLPSNATNPGTIQTGHLMLYGSNTLVLFYKTFSTSYNYTRIARIDNPSDLATVLGSGNRTVKFEIE
jgi:hypothetical protein